jgi:tetratricopeptide (TPR) repeat protein
MTLKLYRACVILALFLGSVLMAGWPVSARADLPPLKEITPEISFDASGPGLTLTVKAPGAGPVEVEPNEGGVLLTFHGELAPIDTDALVTGSHGKLSAVEQGYDTLLFLSDTMKLTDTSNLGGMVHAMFSPMAPETPAPNAAQTSAAASAADDTKLELTQALIDSQQGDFEAAHDIYEKAISFSPNDPDLRAAYADNEEASGNWRHAQELYHTAATLDPGNQDAVAAALSIDQAYQRNAGTDFEWRDLQGFGIVLASSNTVEQPITDDVRALGEVDADHISTGSARRLTGREFPAHMWVTAESVGARYDDIDGNAAAGYLYTGFDHPGVGAQYSQPTESGHNLFGGEYDRPNWDYLEGLVNNGTRDRAYIGHQEVFSHDLSGEMIVGWNSYNLGNERDLANGPTAEAELRYMLIHDSPDLAVVYNLDAEYSAHTVTRTRYNSDGEIDDQYQPFPLINREVHTVVLDLDTPVSEMFDGVSNGFDKLMGSPAGIENALSDYGLFNAFAGGGADRYGRGGPVVGASWTKSIDIFELQLRTSYEHGLDRESQSGTTAGGYLKARF